VPLVLFSHGFHGNANQSTFLMQGLAAAGYLVLAPNHRDALALGNLPTSMRPDEKFGRPETWTDQTYADREHDVQDVWRAALADASLHVDRHRVALSGHSLGGYTALGLAGAWPSWRSPDLSVRAVLALSPYCQPFITHGTLSGVRVPVMYQGGTRDVGITPALKGPQGAYALTPDPKIFVEMEGAGHFSFSNLRHDQADVQALMVRYSVAFLDHHVMGAPLDPILTQPVAGVSTLQSTEK
jgi:predicted dienelactone hydrolase